MPAVRGESEHRGRDLAAAELRGLLEGCLLGEHQLLGHLSFPDLVLLEGPFVS